MNYKNKHKCWKISVCGTASIKQTRATSGMKYTTVCSTTCSIIALELRHSSLDCCFNWTSELYAAYQHRSPPDTKGGKKQHTKIPCRTPNSCTNKIRGKYSNLVTSLPTSNVITINWHHYTIKWRHYHHMMSLHQVRSFTPSSNVITIKWRHYQVMSITTYDVITIKWRHHHVLWCHHLIEENDARVNGLGLKSWPVQVLLHLSNHNAFHGRVLRQDCLQEVDNLNRKNHRQTCGRIQNQKKTKREIPVRFKTFGTQSLRSYTISHT